MFISTKAPELQNFDPTKSGQFELPPLGIYNEAFKIVGMEDGKTQKNEGKLDVTFEISTGAIAGFQFQIAYNIAHSNPDTAKWAIQDLMKIGYGITGDKNYGRSGGGFNTNDLINQSFSATLDVHPGKKLNDKGEPWPQARFKKVVPVKTPGQPTSAGNYNQPAPVQPQQQPAQGAAATWGQPQ